MTKCPTCQGTGFNLDDADLPPEEQRLCEACGGDGRIVDDEDRRLNSGDTKRDDEMMEG